MMTTPERLRRRQRRETAGLLVVFVLCIGSTIYSIGEDHAQDKCLSGFVQNQNETSAIRSAAVEHESEATRTIIKGVFTATNGKQVRAAYDKYVRALEKIDQARDENPVKPFPNGLCGL